jgi:ubiquinone/menaquinone biosynthesis C-methylase UbiE
MQQLILTQEWKIIFVSMSIIFLCHKKSILDVGTGEGSFVKYLREVVGNKNAYGVESSEFVVEQGTDGIFVADGLELPFDDNTFELVTAKHYLPIFLALGEEKNKRAIDELLRVLNLGGKLVADIFTPENEMEKFRVLNTESPLGGTLNENEEWYVKRIHTAKFVMEYLKQIKSNGFGVSLGTNKKGDTILTVIKTG